MGSDALPRKSSILLADVETHVIDPWYDRSTLCGRDRALFDGDPFPLVTVGVSDWHDATCEGCKTHVVARWEVAR